jgi:hypothetical protein
MYSKEKGGFGAVRSAVEFFDHFKHGTSVGLGDAPDRATEGYNTAACCHEGLSNISLQSAAEY